MRRINRITLAVAACGLCSVGVTAAVQASNAGKVLICHGTDSESNPYVLISVSENAVATHLEGHGANNYPDFLLSAGRSDCSGGPNSGSGGE
jgi:hypothetical protein